MLPSNLPILKQMISDAGFRNFAFELDEMFRADPDYTPRHGRQIFESAARGERIIPFEDRYVISSFVPPVPSRAFKTFVSAGVDKSRLYKDLATARRSAPLSVHMCITTRCPYRCEHCGATVPDTHSELTKYEWIRIINDLQDLGIANIVFSGGEPLARKDIAEIVASVDDRSSTLMFTNGALLTPEKAKSLKESGLFILAVSLDSPYPEQHNKIRRNPKAFGNAIAAIRNSARAGLYTVVSSVVFRKYLNKEHLTALFELAKDNGAHEVRIHRPIAQGELAYSDQADEIFLQQEDVDRLFEIQFDANREKDGLKVSSFPYTEGPGKFGCGAGVMHSYISSTGDIWPCDFVPLSFGNALTDDVKEVYGRMIKAAGVPRRYCLAARLAAETRGRTLPIRGEEAIRLTEANQSQSYPDFFKDLQQVGQARPKRQRPKLSPHFIPVPCADCPAAGLPMSADTPIIT